MAEQNHTPVPPPANTTSSQNKPHLRAADTQSRYTGNDGTIDIQTREATHRQIATGRQATVASILQTQAAPGGLVSQGQTEKDDPVKGTTAGLSHDNSGWVALGPHDVCGRIPAILPVMQSAAGGSKKLVLYAGAASGGVWYSDDHGMHWVPTEDLMPNVAISCLAADPGDDTGKTLFAGTGESVHDKGLDIIERPHMPGGGVLKSTDGWSWEPVEQTRVSRDNPDFGTRFDYVNSLLFSKVGDTHILVAATNRGVFYSSDQAHETWTQARLGYVNSEKPEEDYHLFSTPFASEPNGLATHVKAVFVYIQSVNDAIDSINEADANGSSAEKKETFQQALTTLLSGEKLTTAQTNIEKVLADADREYTAQLETMKGEYFSGATKKTGDNTKIIVDLNEITDQFTQLQEEFKQPDPSRREPVKVLCSKRIQCIAVHPSEPHILVASSEYGAHTYRSDDGGKSWTKLPKPSGSFARGRTQICFARKKDPGEKDVVYVSVYQDEKDVEHEREKEYGEIWRYVDYQHPAIHLHAEVEVTVIGDGTEALPDKPSKEHIFQQAFYNQCLWAGDPDDNNLLLLGTKQLWRSTNGGESFEIIIDILNDEEWKTYKTTSRPHVDQHFIIEHPNYGQAGVDFVLKNADGKQQIHAKPDVTNKQLYLGNDGGIYTTFDITKPFAINNEAIPVNDEELTAWLAEATVKTWWASIRHGLSAIQFYHGTGNPKTRVVLAAAQDNGVHSHTPGNYHWDKDKVTGSDGACVAFDPDNDNRFYASTQGLNIQRCIRQKDADGVISWEATTIANGENIFDIAENKHLFIAPFRMDPQNAKVLYACAASLWRTADATAAVDNGAWGELDYDNLSSDSIYNDALLEINLLKDARDKIYTNVGRTNVKWNPILFQHTHAVDSKGYISTISIDQPASQTGQSESFSQRILVGYTSGEVWFSEQANQTEENLAAFGKLFEINSIYKTKLGHFNSWLKKSEEKLNGSDELIGLEGELAREQASKEAELSTKKGELEGYENSLANLSSQSTLQRNYYEKLVTDKKIEINDISEQIHEKEHEIRNEKFKIDFYKGLENRQEAIQELNSLKSNLQTDQGKLEAVKDRLDPGGTEERKYEGAISEIGSRIGKLDSIITSYTEKVNEQGQIQKLETAIAQHETRLNAQTAFLATQKRIWKKMDITYSSRCLGLLIHPHDPSTLYACFGGFQDGNLWRSTDSGQSWSNDISTGKLPPVPIHCITVHPKREHWLYAGTNIGLFASEDGGESWAVSNEGPTSVAIFELFWMDTTLVAVTFGRGLFQVDIPVHDEAKKFLFADNHSTLRCLSFSEDNIIHNQIALGASGIRGSASPILVAHNSRSLQDVDASLGGTLQTAAFFGDEGGNIFWVDAETGPKSKQTVDGSIQARPELWQDPENEDKLFLIVSTNKGKLYKLEVHGEDGLKAPVLITAFFMPSEDGSVPMVYANEVVDNWAYITSSQGMFAIRLIGDAPGVAWGGEELSCQGPPLLAAHTAYVISYLDKGMYDLSPVHAFDLRNGEDIWDKEGQSIHNLFNEESGYAIARRSPFQPIWAMGLVVVACTDGNIYLFPHDSQDAEDYSIHADYLVSADEQIIGITADDNVLYVLTYDSPVTYIYKLTIVQAADSWELEKNAMAVVPGKSSSRANRFAPSPFIVGEKLYTLIGNACYCFNTQEQEGKLERMYSWDLGEGFDIDPASGSIPAQPTDDSGTRSFTATLLVDQDPPIEAASWPKYSLSAPKANGVNDGSWILSVGKSLGLPAKKSNGKRTDGRTNQCISFFMDPPPTGFAGLNLEVALPEKISIGSLSSITAIKTPYKSDGITIKLYLDSILLVQVSFWSNEVVIKALVKMESNKDDLKYIGIEKVFDTIIFGSGTSPTKGSATTNIVVYGTDQVKHNLEVSNSINFVKSIQELSQYDPKINYNKKVYLNPVNAKEELTKVQPPVPQDKINKLEAELEKQPIDDLNEIWYSTFSKIFGGFVPDNIEHTLRFDGNTVITMLHDIPLNGVNYAVSNTNNLTITDGAQKPVSLSHLHAVSLWDRPLDEEELAWHKAEMIKKRGAAETKPKAYFGLNGDFTSAIFSFTSHLSPAVIYPEAAAPQAEVLASPSADVPSSVGAPSPAPQVEGFTKEDHVYSSSPPPQPVDDITRIEGIGAKSAEILRAAGYNSFRSIAAASPEELKAVLTHVSRRFNAFDTSTWPEQARLAAAGKWEELEKLQDELHGGRRRS